MNNFKIENSGDTTKIYILGAIGGYDGIHAEDLVPEIHKIKSNKIDVHVNSMGGDVFQATSIFNALQENTAFKTAYVDGYAASAASYLIQAADEIVMGTGTQMMIHDAEGGYQGNVSGIDAFKSLLDSVSNSIAEFYAKRSGKPASEWRKKMKSETWYTAEEAVAAGLADRVAGGSMNPANKINMQLALTNSGYKYKGRENAPDPEIASNSNTLTDVLTDTKEEQPTTLKVDLISIFENAFKEANNE
jgi:ATP-dependent protease ClpP protease subunit